MDKNNKRVILDFLLITFLIILSYVLISIVIVSICIQALFENNPNLPIIMYIIGTIPGIAVGTIFTGYWITNVLEYSH